MDEATKQDLKRAMEHLELSITVRFGAMLLLTIGALAALVKLT